MSLVFLLERYEIIYLENLKIFSQFFLTGYFEFLINFKLGFFMNFTACRSLLFTPANRPDRFLKALETKADGLVIDLEDAVSQKDKDSARLGLIEFLKTKPFEKNNNKSRPFLVCVRINSIQTLAGLKDITALCESKIFPDALVFPKVEYAEEIKLYDKYFSLPECQNLSYMALIETAIGLENAYKIAHASPRLSGLTFGGADLAADLGAELSFEPMFYARSRIVQAAKSAGLCALDVPFLDIHNDAGNKEEAERVKKMGYTGKYAIHPAQIETLYQVFTPSPEDLNRAQGIVDAYNQAGGNVAEFNGKMIDVPVYKSAMRILNIGK